MKKNPYELRFDIYSAAENRLQQRYCDELDDFRRNSNDNINNLAISDTTTNIRPKFPSLEEVFDEASKIKSFVENKDNS